ncbi:unnamed protein product, partial [Symbiodinium necroappetens]
EETLQWRAARSRFEWFGTIKELLGGLHSEELLQKLHFTLQPLGTQPEAAKMGAWAAEQMDTLATFTSYSLELAACHAWANAIYCVCLPHAFACVQHRSQHERAAGLTRIREVWGAVLRAEHWLQDPSLPAHVKLGLKDLLQDVAWNQWQLAREVYAACTTENWDSGSEELQDFSFLVFSGWSKFFYMTCVPSQDDLEWPRLEPTYEDFLAAVNRRAALCKPDNLLEQNQRVFAMSEKFKLPAALNFTLNNLKKPGGKPAGTFSNQVMTAATAFIANMSSPLDGSMGKAWTGGGVAALYNVHQSSYVA